MIDSEKEQTGFLPTAAGEERLFKKNPQRKNTPPAKASKTKLAMLPLTKIATPESPGVSTGSNHPQISTHGGPLDFPNITFIDDSDYEDQLDPQADTVAEEKAFQIEAETETDQNQYVEREGNISTDDTTEKDQNTQDTRTTENARNTDNNQSTKSNQHTRTGASTKIAEHQAQAHHSGPVKKVQLVAVEARSSATRQIQACQRGFVSQQNSASLCGERDLLDFSTKRGDLAPKCRGSPPNRSENRRRLSPASESLNFLRKQMLLRKESQRQRNARKSFTADSTTCYALAAAISPVLVAHSVSDLGSFNQAISPGLLGATATTSIASMISLPGMPPVPGLSEAQIAAGNRNLKATSLATSGSGRLQQNEEILILKKQRQKEFSGMRPAKLREESSILKNIQRREMIDKVLNFSKKEQRENEEKRRLKEEFDIASGILKTRSILLAPTIPAGGSNSNSGTTDDEVSISSQSIQLSSSIKPVPEKPLQRRIVRKIVESRIHYSLEMKKLAETRFSESEFVLQCLDWHNRYRARHHSPPLQFDAILCATAQHWANMLAHRDEFCYQNPPNVGENLFAWPIPVVSGNSFTKKKPPAVSGKDVAINWYKTKRNYDFSKNPNVLHAHAAQFTQMIWYGSVRFGCGKARSRSGKVIAVAHYQPKGNIPGLFLDNVFESEVESDFDVNEEDSEEEQVLKSVFKSTHMKKK